MNPFSRVTQSFSAFWNERSPRERIQIASAATVAGCALIYVLLIAPALSGQAQLQKNLPALRLQAAQMEALSKEATALSTVPAQPPQPMSREIIEAALARKGLKAQNVGLTGEIAKLQLTSISFAALLECLDDLQKTARIVVAEANINALPKTDTVNAALTLRQQRSD